MRFCCAHFTIRFRILSSWADSSCITGKPSLMPYSCIWLFFISVIKTIRPCCLMNWKYHPAVSSALISIIIVSFWLKPTCWWCLGLPIWIFTGLFYYSEYWICGNSPSYFIEGCYYSNLQMMSGHLLDLNALASLSILMTMWDFDAIVIDCELSFLILENLFRCFGYALVWNPHFRWISSDVVHT